MIAADRLARGLLESHPPRAAAVLGQMPAAGAAEVLRAVPPGIASTVMRAMTVFYAAECLRTLAPAEGAAIVAEMATGDATGIVRALEPTQRDSLLAALPDDARKPIARLLPYVEGTAGAVMDPSIFQLPDDIMVNDARMRLGSAARDLLHYLYVVDRERRLVGVLDIAELMVAGARDPVSAVMHRDVDRLSVWMPVSLVREHAAWQHFHAMPVVDDDDRLVGAVRYQTLRRLEREASARSPADPARITAGALAELFQLGTSGLVAGIAATSSAGRKADREPGTGKEVADAE
ncbi:MAG: CBS domain-containing protein [Gemmatimonadota bacterium]